MPIQSTDLILYASANMPTDDTSPSGGDIDTGVRPVFVQLTAAAPIAAVSDGSDTRQVTLIGRDPGGALVSETLTLNGTTEVLSSQTYERLLRAMLSASDPARTVALKQGSGGPTIATIPPYEVGVTATFINSASSGAVETRYEKLFWYNAHDSLTLNAAQVVLTEDPAGTIQIGLETTKNSDASVANRKTAPSGVTFVDDNVAVDVPGGTLAAGEYIGVWVKQVLAAHGAPVRSTYTLRLIGTSV